LLLRRRDPIAEVISAERLPAANRQLERGGRRGGFEIALLEHLANRVSTRSELELESTLAISKDGRLAVFPDAVVVQIHEHAPAGEGAFALVADAIGVVIAEDRA